MRPATPADIRAMRAIFRAHGDDTPPVQGGADVTGPYLAHLVAHHRVLVVEEADTAVAFGAGGRATPGAAPRRTRSRRCTPTPPGRPLRGRNFA